jgi:hypothetical protein
VRGLNLAFTTFAVSQIWRLFKALKNRLNLESKFKTLLLIFFTANFISLLKNFTSKFIKFTKKTVFLQTRLLSRAVFLLNFTQKTKLFKFSAFESFDLVRCPACAKFDLRGHK